MNVKDIEQRINAQKERIEQLEKVYDSADSMSSFLRAVSNPLNQ